MVPASTLETLGSAPPGEYSMATVAPAGAKAPIPSSMDLRLLYTVLSRSIPLNLPASTWWTNSRGRPSAGTKRKQGRVMKPSSSPTTLRKMGLDPL